MQERGFCICFIFFEYCVTCDVLGFFCPLLGMLRRSVFIHQFSLCCTNGSIRRESWHWEFIDSLALKSHLVAGLKWQCYLLKVSFAFWIFWFTTKLKKCLALTAEKRVIILGKEVISPFWTSQFAKNVFNRKHIQSRCYRILSGFQKFRSTFPGGTSEVMSSKASVNGLFTSEIKIIFEQILYFKRRRYTMLSFHSFVVTLSYSLNILFL